MHSTKNIMTSMSSSQLLTLHDGSPAIKYWQVVGALHDGSPAIECTLTMLPLVSCISRLNINW